MNLLNAYSNLRPAAARTISRVHALRHARGPALARIDAMSDEFCAVLDVASAVSSLHPSPQARHVGESTALALSEHMQAVNVDQSLYRALRSEPCSEAQDPEGCRVRSALLAEFEWDGADLDPASRAAVSLMQNQIRELEWRLQKAPESGEVGPLQMLVEQRHALAKKLGHPSYAHLATSKHSLKTPDKVAEFLNDVRAKLSNSSDADFIQPALPRVHMACGVDGLLRGLEQLALRLFELELRPGARGMCALAKTHTQQTHSVPSATKYAADVVEYHVFSTRDGSAQGHLLLDLAARPGKTRGAALYPLSFNLASSSAQPRQAACVLACEFAGDHLSLRSVLHEFGHALHHLCSRTRYQHLAGTRGPIDLVRGCVAAARTPPTRAHRWKSLRCSWSGWRGTRAS
jgi:Zn-dependent oligopeptidase